MMNTFSMIVAMITTLFPSFDGMTVPIDDDISAAINPPYHHQAVSPVSSDINA